MSRLPVPLLLTLVVAAVAMTGCSGSGAGSAAETTARFADAVARSDGDGACRLLSTPAAQKLSEDEQEPCAQAILGQGLKRAAAIERSEVDGRQAFVVTDTDTVFLSQFPGGWRIIGAGCQARGDAPYDCAVSGD